MTTVNDSSENYEIVSNVAEFIVTKKKRRRATTALAEKLRAIRLWKNLSQTEMLLLVVPDANPNHRALVSQWENQSREPSRRTLIRYAQFAGISLEELLIDERELPEFITAHAEISGEADEVESILSNIRRPTSETFCLPPDSDVMVKLF